VAACEGLFAVIAPGHVCRRHNAGLWLQTRICTNAGRSGCQWGHRMSENAEEGADAERLALRIGVWP